MSITTPAKAAAAAQWDGKSTFECKGNDIWVCEYDPPGNWEGRYKQEVLPAGCK